MTNSEVYEFLDSILIYLRDIGDKATMAKIYVSIENRPMKLDFSIMDSALKKLIKDTHIFENANLLDEYQTEYTISMDGILFINSGGYSQNNRSEIIDNISNLKDELNLEIINRADRPEMFKKNISNLNIETKYTHPEHNPNLWNAKCYDLFKYLFENYYINTKRQLTNIWFFLSLNRNNTYKFYATKDAYKSFILEWYNIEIKNVDKAERKWEEKDLPNLKEHLQNFENT